MKGLKIFYVLISIFFYILINSQYKVDPLFLSQYADSLGNSININYTKNNIKLPYVKWQDNVIAFDSVLPVLNDSFIEIILSTYNSDYANYITYPVFLNDTLISGYLSFNYIVQLSQENDINYIYISKPMFQSNDSALFYMGLNNIDNIDSYSEDIIACYIDNGFKSDLSIFSNHGQTRFFSIWDQTQNFLLPPDSFFIGSEIDSSQIFDYPVYDPNGHGTSVLASYVSSDTLFPGILRKSQIIAVNAELTSKSVMEGIKYIVNKAEKLNKPFVLCIPLNHFWGTHNGESPFDDIINYYFENSKFNRVIVVPAGNLGNKYMHFSNNNLNGDINYNVLQNKHIYIQCAGNNRTDIDIFVNDTLYMRFITRSNHNVIYSDFINIQLNSIGYYQDSNISFKYAYDNIKKQIHIIFTYDKDNILGLEFVSNGFIDGYIAQGGYAIHSIEENNIIKGNNINSLAIPGFAKQAITTASFVSRKYIEENVFSPDPIFSPLLWNGKARKEYYKPNILAPGKYIISYALYNPIYMGNYDYFIGSSYSSAFTAGGVGIFMSIIGDVSVENIHKYIYQGMRAGDNIYSDSVYSGTGIIDVYSSYLQTGVNDKSISYSIHLIENNVLEIKFRNIKRIISAKKNNVNLIINGNKVLDKKLIYGNNLYIIKFEDMKNNTNEIEVKYNYINKNKEEYKNIYDVMGRKLKTTKKYGLYFYIENNKVKKIFKF